MTASRKHNILSIKYFLIIPFILLISLAVLLTGWLAWRFSQNVLLDASHQISQQASEQLQLSISAYLDNAKYANNALKLPLQRGLVSLENPQQLKSYIRSLVSEGKGDINTIQLGTPDGRYYGVGWSHDDQLLEKVATEKTSYAFETRVSHAGSDHGKLLSSRPNYEVTKRPWYEKAVQQYKRDQGAVWSPVYEMYSHKKLGITLSEAVYDANSTLIGVVGTDILLDELSKQLQDTVITDNTLLFVLNDENQLLAINLKEAAPTKTPMTVDAYASQYQLPILTQIMQVMEGAETRHSPFSKTKQLSLTSTPAQKDKQGRYYIHSLPFEYQGLTWQLVSATPEQDVLKNLDGIRKSTVWLLLAALLVTFLLAVALAHRITASLHTLIEQTKAIKNDGTGFTSLNYFSKEFSQLDKAFEKLAMRLQNSFSMIKQGNDLLEETVIERTRQLAQANAKLKRLSYTDQLSQLANRRSFDEFSHDTWKNITQHHSGRLAMLMCDIDYFKEYNDTYGHQAGDECIQRIGQMMLSCTRETDMVARYGGEEFAVIMPGASLDNAKRVAEDVIYNMKQLHIPHVSSLAAAHVTVSIGIAVVDDTYETALDDASVLLGEADKALYEAKHAGRNCFRVAQR